MVGTGIGEPKSIKLMDGVNFYGNVMDMAPMERPREKFRRKGAAALSDVELLAVMLGSGTAKFPVLNMCENLISVAGGSLQQLAALDMEALCKVAGIGEVRALSFLASVALAKRLNAVYPENGVPELDQEELAAFLSPVLTQACDQQFVAVLLTVERRLLATVELAGTDCQLPDIGHVIRIVTDARAPRFFLAYKIEKGMEDEQGFKKDYCSKMRLAAEIMRLAFEGMVGFDGKAICRVNHV